MARGRGLYGTILEPENLLLAFHKAAKGKSDRPEVVEYRRGLDDNLVSLRAELLSGEISLGPYRFFTVRDPKERTICAAPFRDRVLHHAVMNVTELEFERYSVFDSYACRPGKGLHRAIARAQEFSRRHSWFLKLDVRKYFVSIDHGVLLELLARRFTDRRVVELFGTIVSSYHAGPGKGIPIGNLVSQHLANFYLGALDHMVEQRRAGGFVRYMDDILLFGDSREELRAEERAVERFLGAVLRLVVKDDRQLNRSCLGIPFLGFRVWPHRVRLSPRSRRRFVDKLRQYEGKAKVGRLSERELARRMTSVVSFTRTADAVGFRRHVLNGRGYGLDGL